MHIGGVTIGQASRDSGIKVPTIRYYEQIGLLPKADRREGGHRGGRRLRRGLMPRARN